MSISISGLIFCRIRLSSLPFAKPSATFLNIILFDDQPSHIVRPTLGDNLSRKAKAGGMVKSSMTPLSLSWFDIEVDDALGGGG